MDCLALLVCAFALYALSRLFVGLGGAGCLEQLVTAFVLVIVGALVVFVLVMAGIGE